MSAQKESPDRKIARIGWGLSIAFSIIMIIAGLGWFFALPGMLLENIAEMANLDPAQFRVGDPSASDLIAMIAQGYGLGFSAVGIVSLILALAGFRSGARLAWNALWILAITFAGLAYTFLRIGENAILSLGVLSFAVLSLVGQLLARKDFS